MASPSSSDPSAGGTRREDDLAAGRERMLAEELATCREALEQAESAAAKLAPALHELEAARTEARSARSRAETAEQALAGVTGSATWRLTAPLRRAAASRHRGGQD
jgi:chromosome segregation ATPase